MVMEAVPSPQCLGREFVHQYYTCLNKAPQNLHRFYNHDSSFVHGGLKEHLPEEVHGQQQIHEKIFELNFHDCKAKNLLVDSHRTLENGVVVQVSGELSNNGQPMRRFVQTFVLAPHPQSAKDYYVRNDIFRYQDDAFFDDEDGVEDSPVENENEVQQPRPAPVEVNHAPVAPAVVPQPTVQQTELTARPAIGMNGTDHHVEEEIRQRTTPSDEMKESHSDNPNKYSKFISKNLNITEKRRIMKKENELKVILRPYMPPHSRSRRKLCYAGDGRENGIIFASLYRLLQCNFTLAPNPDDLNEDECEELGICTKKGHTYYYAFFVAMDLVKDIPGIASLTGQLPRLPPSLGTLIGYRGLEQHRDYLQSSASRPFVAWRQNNATITELDGDDETNALEGPSGQSGTVPNSVEVEEPIESGSNEQEDEDGSDDEEISCPRRKPDEIIIGDKIADSLLLKRMIALFFWPGIMSYMSQEAAEVHPKSPRTKLKNKAVKAPGKRQVKKAKYNHIRQLVFNRYGSCRPKKTAAAAAMLSKRLAEKKKVQPRRKRIVPKSDRVTRGCKKLDSTDGDLHKK